MVVDQRFRQARRTLVPDHWRTGFDWRLSLEIVEETPPSWWLELDNGGIKKQVIKIYVDLFYCKDFFGSFSSFSTPDHKKQILWKTNQYYLLLGLLWVQVGEKQYKMYGATPTGQYKSYSYYITHSKPQGKTIRLNTDTIEQQILGWLAGVSVNEKAIPEIRKIYQAEIRKFTKDDRNESLTNLKRRLSELKEEEARLARLMITGHLTEDALKQLRQEWQEKVVNVQCKINELELDLSQYLDDLEMALVLMTYIGKLFERLEDKQKNKAA
jgi:hypothetical protein